MEPFQDDIVSQRLDDNRLATMLDAINDLLDRGNGHEEDAV